MTLSIALKHAFAGFTLDASFDAPPGVTALFGRSGAGKTSVVNALAGLLTPDAGRITLNDRVLFDRAQGINLPVHQRRIGYVFQDSRLFPHLTVRDNLLYPARVNGRPNTYAKINHVVDMLGIAKLLDRRPQTLSGGEKQRVAIGRALLSNPEILLLDEPLAALDYDRKSQIMPYLERLRDATRIPILYVSHEIEEVARLATTLVLMADGRAHRAGPAETLLSDPDLAPLLGLRDVGALISGRIVAHHADGLSEIAISAGSLFLPRVDAAIGTTLRIRIEAQDVILSRDRPAGLSALNILPARVRTLKMGDGPGVIAQLDLGDTTLLARLTRRSATALALAPGVHCHAVVKSVAVAQGNITRTRPLA